MLPAPPAAGSREAEVITAAEDTALQVRDLLQRDAAAAAEAGQASHEVARSVLAQAVSLPADASAEAVRQSSLAALQGGLLCGALDGLITLTAHQAVSAPSLSVPAALEAKRDLLLSGMAKAREVAQGDWAAMPTDDLQLLAGYGKHQNLHTGDESQALVGQPLAAQAEWLMATFKAGYAIGVADAAIMARGENPDPTV